MFDGIRKKLAQAANEEEIVFKKQVNEDPDNDKEISFTNDDPPAPKSSSIEGNNIELKVVRPETMEEIFTIADYLIDGCTVVLNLELLEKSSVTRMLDFLNGVTYTTGGEVKNVSQGTFIITPSGINIDR